MKTKKHKPNELKYFPKENEEVKESFFCKNKNTIINYTVKLPHMRTITRQKCVAVASGRIFNKLPLDARKTESRIVFTSF